MIHIIYKKEIIKELQQSLSFFKMTNPDYIVIRCPLCGDSKKTKNKGHLGIAKDRPVWNCLRCNKGGRTDKLFSLLLNRKLSLLDIIEEEYKEQIVYNSTFKFSGTYFKNTKSKSEISLGFSEETTSDKIEYFKKRIKQDQIPDYMNNVIIDDKDFIVNNYLKTGIKFRDFSIEDSVFFDNYYNENIFFMSDRCSFIVSRDITGKAKMRYNIISENKLLDYISFLNPNKKYENSIFEKRNINVCIGEGIFDVLNAAEIDYFKNEIDIFIVAMGKNIKNVFRYLNIFYNIFSFDLHLLLDNTEDVDLNKFKYVIRSCNFMVNSVKLYRAEGRNVFDFGDYDKNNSRLNIMKFY